ncbi:MAG: hypothetical protein U0V48_09590 [Anaerolineales bacterium]
MNIAVGVLPKSRVLIGSIVWDAIAGRFVKVAVTIANSVAVGTGENHFSIIGEPNNAAIIVLKLIQSEQQ